MKHHFFLFLIMQGAVVVSVNGYDLAGTWHVSTLGLPGSIVQNKDNEGVIIGLSGNDTFEATNGTLTISQAGVVSGFVGSNVTGTGSVNTDGVVTLNLTAPEVMTLTLHVTSSSDLMAASHGSSDYHELLVMAKSPSNAALPDIVGSWWVIEMETPSSLDPHYNSYGKMTGIGSMYSFHQSRHLLVIDANGNYNYNTGEETGTVQVTPDGTASITPDAPTSPALAFHLNELKDTMITANADTGSRSLIVLVKTHDVLNWETAGQWSLSSANLPSYLSVSLNNNSLVTQISGLESIGHTNGSMNITLDGNISGIMEEPFTGNSTSTTDGLIHINHGGPEPFIGAVNQGGDFFTGVENDATGNSLMMMISIRSVRPLTIGMLPGPPLKVVWVPAADGRFLQKTSNIVDWQTIIGSETTSSYTPNLTTEGSKQFYRLAQP